jgi:hypothetical protein
MRSGRSRQQEIGVLVIAFLVLALFLGALLLRKYKEASAPPSAPPTAQQTGTATVTLFFGTGVFDGLAPEGREIDACQELAGCLESILEELINGPVGELQPVLPGAGMFNSVQVVGNLARVDLTQGLVDALPGGSGSEQLAVYAVVNSFAFNYPEVRHVLFTVDGKALETLKGHLDLRLPIDPDFSLAKPRREKVEEK